MGLRDKVALVYTVVFIIFISQVCCMPKTKNNKQRAHKIRTKVDNSLKYSPQFSSVPNFRDLVNFPEVEYPLDARDIWKPNYWNYLFQPTDIAQRNSFKTGAKSKKKVTDYKNAFKKNNSKIKTAPRKSKPLYPVQNNTNGEICSKPMKSFTFTTSSPYSDNFIMKDINSFSVLTKAPVSVEEVGTSTTPIPTIRNTCLANTDTTINTTKQVDINNTKVLNDFCSDDKKNIPTFKPQDNFASKGGEKDIEIDEEFTTDEPEYAYALSTPQPPSTVDVIWRESQVIDPYNSLSYPDELDDYFIAVKS